ncbi:DUF3265 domain-containing protein [Vibrio vulnificus]|nr:DUF3265 domain-containing protein [Vibrio vulnificus]QNE01182.1 DUF3265 domain-containing protein [Vibrio vulnificus]
MAFWVCREFCGESGLRKAGLGGIHPLTRRYVVTRFLHLYFCCIYGLQSEKDRSKK